MRRAYPSPEYTISRHRIDGGELAYLIYLEYHVALLIDMEGGCELRAPNDLVITIGIPGEHRLAERVVISLDQNQYFGLPPFQIRRCFAIEGTIRADRMDDRPCQREEVDGRPLQLEYFIDAFRFGAG